MRMQNVTSSKPNKDNVTITPGSYCWRSDWVRPYESLLSLLDKFAYLNAASRQQITTLVGKTNNALDPNGPKLRPDLNSFALIDEIGLRNLLMVDLSLIEGSTAVGYIRPAEVALFTSTSLRYCPQCVAIGFHSSLHQLLLISHCPVHRTLLINECVNCGTAPQLYRLSSLNKHLGQGCETCPGNLIDNFLKHAKNTWDDLERRELDRLAQCLRMRLRRDWSERSDWLGSLLKPRNRRMLLLPSYWSESLGCDFDVTLARRPIRDFRGTVGTTFPRYLLKAELAQYAQTEYEFNKDLAAIYKSISRSILKKFLRSHYVCVRALNKHVCSAVSSQFGKGTICVSANAYLLWRMRCEGLVDPTMVFKAGSKPKFESIYQLYDRIPQWFTRRIFALNWLGLFYECVLLAKYLNRTGLYSFCPSLIQGSRQPYWIRESPRDGTQRIQWWIRTPQMIPIVRDRSSCVNPKRSNSSNPWGTTQCSCLT
jgi:hypothetical protein